MNPYWHIYHDEQTLTRAATLREEHTIISTGVNIHIDVYPQADPDAPVFIFNHGGGGYSRLFIGLALALHDRGYTVLLPDQRGQGLSGGDRGDFTLGQFVQNICDVATWARERYAGRLVLAGGSVGGALTYMAASAGAPVDAVVCHNLYDFGTARDALAVSRFAPLTHIPGAAQVMHSLIRLGAALLPGLKIPFRLLGSFETMVDRRDTGFYDRWKNDPLPIKAVSLRYLRSVGGTPPAIPFEQNRLPVLVINPTRDRMTDPAITRRNYARLGGPKHYVEIDYGHWAMSAAYVAEWVSQVDGWLREMGLKTVEAGSSQA